MLKKSTEALSAPAAPSTVRYKTVKIFAAGMGIVGLSCLAASAADAWMDRQREASIARSASDLQQEAILRLSGQAMLDSSISKTPTVVTTGPPEPGLAFANWATSVHLLCASELNQPACQKSDVFETAEELNEGEMFAARDTIVTEFTPWDTLDTSLTYTGLGVTAIATVLYATATYRQERFEQMLAIA